VNGRQISTYRCRSDLAGVGCRNGAEDQARRQGYAAAARAAAATPAAMAKTMSPGRLEKMQGKVTRQQVNAPPTPHPLTL
jgi:hypothetical protein